MSKKKIIKTLLLLCLYSFVVLHNFGSHLHTSHGTHTYPSAPGHHSHDHEGHDHEEHHHSHGVLDFLQGVLHCFDHADVGEGHFENYTAQDENFGLEQPVSSQITPALGALLPTIEFQPVKAPAYYNSKPPPRNQNYCFIRSNPFRGPPIYS